MNELIKINDDFIVNLSVVYSVQLVLCKNDAAVNKYYDRYYELYNELYENRIRELNDAYDEIDIIVEHYPELSEHEQDLIKNKVIAEIGEEPEKTTWKYILTLNTGKQVEVDEYIFNQIARHCG